MENTYREFHLGTPLETFIDFVKKVLLPSIAILILLILAFHESEAYAKDSDPDKTVGVDTSVYLLVQHYLKDTALDTGMPHKLFCTGKISDKTCEMFVGANKVDNFLANGKCSKIFSDGDMIEYDCGGNARKRVMKVDKKLHDSFLKDYLLIKIPGLKI
jgi:hypothetical protein